MDHLEFIKLLLDKGANPNARVKDNTLTRTIFTMQWFFEDGATPFVRAAQSSDTALMKLLLEYGADPKIATANGDTALTACGGIGWVEGVTYERSPKENVEAMRMLLDLGLDPNRANNDGRTRADGRGAQGPQRGGAAARRSRREARRSATSGSRDTDKVGVGRRRPHLAGARLRRRPRARRRAVGGRAARDRGAHPQADDRARPAGAADRPQRSSRSASSRSARARHRRAVLGATRPPRPASYSGRRRRPLVFAPSIPSTSKPDSRCSRTPSGPYTVATIEYVPGGSDCHVKKWCFAASAPSSCVSLLRVNCSPSITTLRSRLSGCGETLISVCTDAGANANLVRESKLERWLGLIRRCGRLRRQEARIVEPRGIGAGRDSLCGDSAAGHHQDVYRQT